MLEAAVAIVDGIQQEQVALERRAAVGMPEGDLGFADLPGVGEQPVGVEIGQRAGDDEPVLDAMRLERAAPETPEFDGVVDELVVVVCLEGGATGNVGIDRAHRRRHLPRRRQRADLQPMRLVLASFDAQAQAGAVEEAAVRIEKGGAHRGIEGVDLVAQLQRLVTAAGDVPSRLVALRRHEFAVTLPGVQTRQVARELTDQVAAGNPHRQADPLQRRRVGHRQADAKAMRMKRRDEVDSVGNHEGGSGVGARIREALRTKKSPPKRALRQAEAQRPKPSERERCGLYAGLAPAGRGAKPPRSAPGARSNGSRGALATNGRPASRRGP